jgi:hypothetical protein
LPPLPLPEPLELLAVLLVVQSELQLGPPSQSSPTSMTPLPHVSGTIGPHFAESHCTVRVEHALANAIVPNMHPYPTVRPKERKKLVIARV